MINISYFVKIDIKPYDPLEKKFNKHALYEYKDGKIVTKEIQVLPVNSEMQI